MSALANNVKELNRLMHKGCSLLAIVKDEAYGHGAKEISTALQRMGVDAYGVATVDEGIELREYGITGFILVLGYTDPSRATDLSKYDITQTVFDEAYARELSESGCDIKVHIAVDSGMHRLGLSADDTEAVARLFTLEHLTVDGIFTHLCVSDSHLTEDYEYTVYQVEAFNRLLSELYARGLKTRAQHIVSSYGLLNYPEIKSSYARVGISLYGADSEEGAVKNTDASLLPVMSLRTKIIQLRTFPEGSYIGYGRTFVTKRESRIAVLPIGYADGIPRCLSGKASVLVNGKRAPMVGRICMDQLMIDVTDIEDAKVGSVVTIVGTDGDETITAEEICTQADTITNEFFSRLGRRLDIVVK